MELNCGNCVFAVDAVSEHVGNQALFPTCRSCDSHQTGIRLQCRCRFDLASFLLTVPVVKATWEKDAASLEYYSDVSDASVPTVSLGLANTDRGVRVRSLLPCVGIFSQPVVFTLSPCRTLWKDICHFKTVPECSGAKVWLASHCGWWHTYQVRRRIN